MKQQSTKITALIFLLILSVGLVSSLTGSMGNARMILRMEQGDTLEKYILVKNVNDEAINIELVASGDLVDYIDIKDDNFELAPGTEKKAYFTIKAKEDEMTESNINVKFSPLDGGNGVGLTSTIIVIPSEGDSWWDFGDDDDDIDDDSDADDSSGVSVTTGRVVSNSDGIFKNVKLAVVLLIFLGGIFIILMLVLLLMLRGANKTNKSVNVKNNVKKGVQKGATKSKTKRSALESE